MIKLVSKINVALILLPMSAGMSGCIALTFLKGSTIALKDLGFFGGISHHVYGFLALLSGFLELRFLNKAMELFE